MQFALLFLALLGGVLATEFAELGFQITHGSNQKVVKIYPAMYLPYGQESVYAVGLLEYILLPSNNNDQPIFTSKCTTGCIPLLLVPKNYLSSELHYAIKVISLVSDTMLLACEDLPSVIDEWTEVNLPVSILVFDYNEASLFYKERFHTNIHLTVLPLTLTNHNKMKQHFMKLGVLFLVFGTACCILLMRVRLQRRLIIFRRSNCKVIPNGLAKEVVSKLPVREIDEEEGLKDCTICLDEMGPGVMVKTLQCNHEYHVKCIDPWLLAHATCPLCKYNVLKEQCDDTSSIEGLLAVTTSDEALPTVAPSRLTLSQAEPVIRPSVNEQTL